MDATSTGPDATALLRRLATYRADDRRAFGQLAQSLILYAGLWWAMIAALEISYLLTLLLVVPAGFILLRIFIIQHDCGHGSFTRSKRLNQQLGRALGILTFTPFDYWKQTHSIHHATSGNLDRRGHGDVTTLTVDEYQLLTKAGRLGYRIYRNPLTILGLGPFFIFFIKHRLPLDTPRHWHSAWRSVCMTNLGIAATVGLAAWTIGLPHYLMIQVPVTLFTATFGVFLFYVQHQYEETYWERQDKWSFGAAALHGSSFLDLPKPLHWLTGNICYHHLHHLASRVPNYRLPEAFAEIKEARAVPHLNLGDAFRSLRLHLWDDQKRRLVSFSDLPGDLRSEPRG